MSYEGIVKERLSEILNSITPSSGGGKVWPDLIIYVTSSYTVPIGYNAKIITGVAYGKAAGSTVAIYVKGVYVGLKSLGSLTRGPIRNIRNLMLPSGESFSLSGGVACVCLYQI